MAEQTKVTTLEKVVIRFSGDSGDGMQLTGTIFSNLSAIFGNEISTFPDYPAEVRAPQGTLSGVSGFQVIWDHVKFLSPGDKADVFSRYESRCSESECEAYQTKCNCYYRYRFIQEE